MSCDSFSTDFSGFGCGNYPFYPIQTMCEQANHCKEGENVVRLRELFHSARQWELRYKPHEYSFILEHLQSVLDEIKQGRNKAKVRQKLSDY